MEIEVDHYEFLGLPSGEEGSKLTLTEISKAYRSKALELHPDKRPNDPNAHTNFQKLKSSYEILKDEKARKLFDDLLRVGHEHRQRQSHYDSKRRKMMSDLDERERASFAPDSGSKARDNEGRIAKQFREECERIRAMQFKRSTASETARTELKSEVKKGAAGGEGLLDGEKILKVSWEGNGDIYSVKRLRELFSEFGEVEDVLIKTATKRRRTTTAVVEMKTRDAAVSAMGSVCGDLSNPLLVVPLCKATPAEFSTVFPTRHVEPDDPVASHLFGASRQAKEDSILEKLRKAAEKQR